MTVFCAAGRHKAGVDRRRLKLGTILGSSAVAAALLVPAAAFASAAPAQPGWVQSQLALMQPAQDAAPTPQDLTVRRPTRFAAAAAPNADVNASYGDISTTADHAPGISTNSTGDTVISAGNITTSGNYSPGVLAYGVGKISITTGNVSTYGYASHGVRAQAGGDIAITTGNVSTSGAAAFGIYAYSTGGKVTVQAQNVSIQGVGGYQVGQVSAINDAAIRAYASGDAAVTVQNVSTAGYNSRGVWATSLNGEASVTAGQVTTKGNFSMGILASGVSSEVTLNGALNTYGNGSAGISAQSYAGGSTVHVNGSVSTHGNYSQGVVAESQKGGVTIDGGGNVTTSGASSTAVLAGSDGGAGSVSVTLGTIVTTGPHSTGLQAQSTGYNNPDQAANIYIDVQKVSTSGSTSSGILAADETPWDLGAAAGGVLNITVHDSVTTRGYFAQGIEAISGGAININVANNVSTLGGYSDAIVAAAQQSVTISVGGTVSTQGDHAPGILAVSYGPGNISITAPTVQTAGNAANGIQAEDLKPYSGPGVGNITITTGSVTTAGDNALGVYAISEAGDVAVNVKNVSTRGVYADGVLASGVNASIQATGTVSTLGKGAAGLAAYGYTASVQAATVTTAGDKAPGIVAYAGADATVTAGSVTTSGAGSTGVVAFGFRNVTVNVQNVATTGQGADAIDATNEGGGAIAVGVSGKIAASGAGSNGVVAINYGGATNIIVASGGSVSGAADAIQVQSSGGPVTISNAGVITGGSGFAINVTGLPQTAATASAQIVNTGTLVGAVNLAAGGNTLTNAGTFVATKDSEFGGGGSQFVNTGVVKAAGTVSFLDLTTFANTGGLIDLRNGQAGDVFTLTGDYVASGDARLGLDVNGATADKLVIAGTATGATTILLGVSPANATLLAKPVTLVQAGAGSTGTFAIGNPNVGLIHYGLTTGSGTAQGPVSNGPMGGAAPPVSYTLTASAGAPVYGMLKLEESAQTVWRQSADAWSEHLAAMRGDAWGGQGQGVASTGASSGYGLGSNRYWVQAYGSSGDRNQTAGGFSTNYNQTDAGVQAGADLGRTATRLGDVGWGVTAGYTNSQIDAQGGTLKSDVDTFNFGGYAALSRGPYFANALVKFDHNQISNSDSVAGYSVNLSGSSYGAQFELGRHFGTGRWAFEPTVSLTVVKTSLDTASIYNQTLAFQDEDGVTGKIGGRFYTNRTFHNGTTAVFYAGAALVDDFTGDQKATFSSGGTSQDVSANGDGAYAQAVAGVSSNARGVTFYLQGEAAFGGSHSGGGVRLGARF